MLQSACQQPNQPVSACCSSHPLACPNSAGTRNKDISVISQCCEYNVNTECSDHVDPCAELATGSMDVEDLADFCRFLDQREASTSPQKCNVPAQLQQPKQLVAQTGLPVCINGQPRAVQSVNSAICVPSNNYCQVQQVPNINGVVSRCNSQSNYTQPVKRVTIDVEDLGKLYNHLGQSNSNTCLSQNCNYAVPQRKQQQQQQQQQQPIQCPSRVNNSCAYSCQVQQPVQQQVPLQPIQNPNNYVSTQLNQAPFIPPSMTVEQAAFNYCTGSRWMACPATSVCPLYDESQRPLTSWQSLPCAQSFQNYYMNDEDAIEEYLSNEKRKEKSRDAARSRRSRESNIFTGLAEELPVPACEVSHLDKASIMRLAIAHLKTRQLVGSVQKSLTKTESTSEMDELFLKALDGFVMVLDNNGDMVYLSGNVKNFLGIAQMDLMGQSVFDYSHPCDHDEIRESISHKSSESEDNPCNIFIRLKCTLTSKGRKVNLKSASYKVIHCIGRYVLNDEVQKSSPIASTSSDDDYENNNTSISEEDDAVKEDKSGDEKGPPKAFLVCVASPVPHPSNIEIALGKFIFLSKHNLNMKYTYADDKLTEYLGWDGSDLMGQSLFDFHHALDDLSLDKSFKSLFHKGQCETIAYRFLNKTGGYAWVVTQATLIHCARSQKPQSIVCIHYLLSGVEHEDEVYSMRQVEARAAASPLLIESPTTVEVESPQAYELSPAQTAPSPNAEVVSTTSLRKPLQPTTPHSVTQSLFLQACKPRATVPAVPRVLKEDIENHHFEIKPDNDEVDQLLTPIIFPDEEDQERLVNEGLKKSESTTANLFAPRTEDMNKGFLTFSEDQPGVAMLKEEPDDLTHLAPEAGDECVPLEDGPLLTDVLDEFLLNGNYCSLLGPEGPQDPLTEAVCRAQFDANFGQTLRTDSGGSSSGVSSDPLSISPSILGQSTADCLQLGDSLRDDCSSDGGDPFIYRDTPSRCSLGTDLPSPTMSKSLDGSGIDDSLSPTGSIGCGTGALSDEEMLMLGITDVTVDEEVNCKPFITVNDNDEALELLINNDTVMWGPRQTSIKKSKWITDETKNPKSSLAQLLTNESNSSKKLKYNSGAMLVNPSQVLGQINTKNNVAKINNCNSTAERSNKRTHALSFKSQNRQNQQQLLQQQHEPPENKRFKQTHNESSGISQFSNDMFNIANVHQKNSQLLQQLVSQNLPKNSRNMWLGQQQQQQLPQKANNCNNNIFNDNGNRLNSLNNGMNVAGKAGRSNVLPPQQQQSNSVLMNLLVSGCDIQAIQNQVLQEATLPNICAPKMDFIQNLKQQQQQSITMDAESFQALPFWDNALDNSQSFLYSKQLQYQQQQPQLLQPQPQQQQLFDKKSITSGLDQMSLDAVEFMFGPESDELLRALDPNLV